MSACSAEDVLKIDDGDWLVRDVHNRIFDFEGICKLEGRDDATVGGGSGNVNFGFGSRIVASGRLDAGMAGALGSRKGPSVLVVDLSINRDPPPILLPWLARRLGCQFLGNGYSLLAVGCLASIVKSDSGSKSMRRS